MILIKNGIFVPYIYFIILNILNNNYLLSTAISIRLFTINYFYWFAEWSFRGQLKQFVRFTDSQTVLCLLYYYLNKNKLIEKITYNILLLVTFGFWIGKLSGIDETSTAILIKYPFFQTEINNLYHYINHGLLFLLFSIDKPIFYGFTIDAINKTLLFILFYLMLIYIPWYVITNDTIYNI